MSDVEYQSGEFIFEWDSEKSAFNFRKHGIRFEDATLVFSDENSIIYHDDLHSQDEDRWKIIGLVENVLLVVFTERGEALRIISARAATPRERREYYACATSYL